MRSIHSRLLTAFIGLAVVPLLIMGVLFSLDYYRVRRGTVSSLQNEMVKRISEELGGFIRQRERLLALTATAYRPDPEIPLGFRNMVEQLLYWDNAFEEILVSDPRGETLLREHQYKLLTPETPFSFCFNDALKYTVETAKTWYGPVRFNETNGQPVMEIAVPLLSPSREEVMGILVGSFRVKRIWELLASLDLNIDEWVYVLDENNQVIAHPNPTMVLRQQQFNPDMPNRGLDGTPAFLTVLPMSLGNNRFTVVAEQGIRQALKPWYRTMLLLVLILVGVVAVAISLGFVIIGKIVKPIKTLFNAAVAVQNGDMTRRVLLCDYEEISLLGSTFNSMLEHLNLSMEELRNLKELFRNIIDSMPSLIAAVDRDWRITQWNLTASRLTGIPPAEARGRLIVQVFPDVTDLPYYLHRALDEGLALERKVIHRLNDQERISNLTVYPLLTGDLSGAVVRFDDITAAEKREAHLIQIQKMETVGTLAGGLVHDFNNILSGIIGTVSLLQDQAESRDFLPSREVSEHLAVLELSGNRAAELVHNLLTLSRKQEQNLEVLDLNELILRTIKLCSGSLHKSVSLLPSYSDTSALVLADPGQMEQVLLNFIINAAHSMTIMREPEVPWGGKISLDLKLFHGGEPFLTQNPEAVDTDYWRLSVEDEGVGMDEETRKNLFTPFFTTKGKENGTGLGLAMVFSLVRQNRGFVHVYSEPGRGSVFSIYLPVYHPEV